MADSGDPRIDGLILRRLFAYWESCRRGQVYPRRADFDPLAIPELLPHLFLIDIEHGADPRFRIRLSGTFIDSVFARSSASRYLDDSPINRREPKRLDVYRRVAQSGRPEASHTSFVDDQGRRYAYERLLLPLAVDDPARVDMIVGALAFDAPVPSPTPGLRDR
ncbi:MAG: PAS domain-containing protein [Alphaproteobacteria bacterium]|nr:PAS domain-containing protein [Alphaproteobacteria bacterium]